MCSDAPDTSGMNEAAARSAQLSEKAFEWFKGEYERTAPVRAAAERRANQVSDAQLAGMNTATRMAEEADARNKSVFQPLENKLVADAQGFDTSGRRADAASRAAADVEASFGASQQGLNRALMRSGAMPGADASAALMQDAALAKAKARAGATSGAVQNVEQQGYARMMDAASLGRNLPGTQATQQQIATQSGNSSSANAQQALQAQMSGAGLMQSGFNTALQGQGQAGQLYGQAAQMSAQGGNDGLMGALGGVAGSFAGSKAGSTLLAGWMSDKNKKKDRRPTDEDQALAEINATPVEDWQYDPAKGGPDDGVTHTGPMAQQVLATMGPQAAPGGKVIDPVTMNGKVMAAMQSLTKRLERIEKEVA